MNILGFNISRQEGPGEHEKIVSALKKDLNDLKFAIGSMEKESKEMQELLKEGRRSLPMPALYQTRAESPLSSDKRESKKLYYDSGYDLAEIGRAMDIEPYINQSIRKHREQIMKSGFSIDCEDEEIKDYLYRRLFEMTIVSGITTEQWIREFSNNLVAYGTAFLIKKRNKERSSGRTLRMYGKDLDPIAAIFPLDPTSVTVSVNELGYPVTWKQKVENAIGEKQENRFDNDDMIVATMDKKTGFIFGTPYILPVLDDVRTLRRLEELSERLAQRNTFPQIHWKVGTDEFPALITEDGQDEVSIVRANVESMNKEGGVVTTHRVAAEIIGGDRQTLDLMPYIEYFESRVLGGLRLSEVDIGRGNTSKASAVTVSQGLQDSARDFQAVIADAITSFLLIPLALEGGYDLEYGKNIPKFEFEEMDGEKCRADEAHGADLFNTGGITHEEFRRDYLRKKPVPEEKKGDLKNENDHAKQVELQKISGEQAIAKAKVSKSASNKIANRSRPSNQSGRKASKTRVVKNSLEIIEDAYVSSLRSTLKEARSQMWSIVEKHKNGADSMEEMDLSTKSEQIEAAFDLFIGTSLVEARKLLDPVIINGSKDCMAELKVQGSFEVPKKYIDRFYKNFVEKALTKVKENGIKLINESDALSGGQVDRPLPFYVTGIFDVLQEDLKSLADKHINVAYRIGYARAARSFGYKTVVLKPDDAGWYCEDCEERGDIEISLIDKNNSYANNLTTHSGCEFEITLGIK